MMDDVGEALFWAPLVALLGGGREEEILQRCPKDFVKIDGRDDYRMQRGLGSSSKSNAAGRLIPVYPELIRLGLIRLVGFRRDKGEPRLLPQLTAPGLGRTLASILSVRQEAPGHPDR
jgi:hypothetical protein